MEGEDQPRLEERPDSVTGSRAGGRVVPAPKPLTREELLAASWVPTRRVLPLGRAAEGGARGGPETEERLGQGEAPAELAAGGAANTRRLGRAMPTVPSSSRCVS